MCLILDANCYTDYLTPDHRDMAPVKKWVESRGAIAHSPTPQLEKELQGPNSKIRKLFGRYLADGGLKVVDKEDVKQKQDELALCHLRSNDAHIIALALVAEVRLLVSQDQKLDEDYKNTMRKAGLGSVSIYKRNNKEHRKLLENNTCKKTKSANAVQQRRKCLGVIEA